MGSKKYAKKKREETIVYSSPFSFFFSPTSFKTCGKMFWRWKTSSSSSNHGRATGGMSTGEKGESHQQHSQWKEIGYDDDGGSAELEQSVGRHSTNDGPLSHSNGVKINENGGGVGKDGTSTHWTSLPQTLPPPSSPSTARSPAFADVPPSLWLTSSSAKEKHLSLVGKKDLEGLTEKDIRDLLCNIQRCQKKDEEGEKRACAVLTMAMTHLLEGQRFSDVISGCPPSVFRAARSCVELGHHLTARRLFSEKLSRLYGVLPFIPLSLLSEVEESGA